MLLLNKFKICSKPQIKNKESFDLVKNKNEITVIYFTGYDSDDEILDATSTVESLIKYGVNKEYIYIFAPSGLKDVMSYGVNFFSPEDYNKEISKINKKYLLFYIGGHGAHYGVGYKTSINGNDLEKIFKPNELIAPLDSIENLKLCVLFITQCYAGVFNYWDTYSKKYKMCIMGATGMHTAIAASIGDNTTICNVFLHYINQWLISSDRDLDGDGKCSLLDCYKFGGTYTGKFFLNFRQVKFVKVNTIYKELTTSSIEEYLKIMKLKELKQELDFLHSVQEPWILNANLAREIVF